MDANDNKLFGTKEAFGIEIARCFAVDDALFGGACLWIRGKSLGDLSSTMAFHPLALELESLNYLERMEAASVGRLLSFESIAMDWATDELMRETPRQISRFSPGECFDGMEVRVVAAAYDVIFFARPPIASRHGPTLSHPVPWVEYQPAVRAFRQFLYGPTETPPWER